MNGFANQLINRNQDKKTIGVDDYYEIENWYLRETLDKNVANIVSKARKYRNFVEGLLFRENKVPFNINRAAIKFLSNNGVIYKDNEGFVDFKVPLYKKVLHETF